MDEIEGITNQSKLIPAGCDVWTETVASAIEWAMAELMKSPEDQIRLPARARRRGGFRAARGGK